MSHDQFVVWFVCFGFGVWAGRYALVAAVRAVRAWYGPEPLAPKSRYDGIDL